MTVFAQKPIHDRGAFLVVVAVQRHLSSSRLADTLEFACALPILKRSARRAGVVVPLFRLKAVDPAHVTVIVDERAVTCWTR